MKSPLSALALALGLGAATAQTTTTAPASVTSVAQAMQAKDDAYVTLEGTVVRKISGERYEFRDASGSMTVEIDDDKWPNRQPMLNQRVRLQGEVERKLIRKTVEVEVDRVAVLK